MTARLAPLLCLVVVVASACATTTQQVQANGEPLEAVIKEHTYEGYWLSDEWHPPHSEVNFDGLKQGDEEIDELDFYFIAKDQPSIDRIVKSRDDENLAYRLLYGGGAVGGALVVAGFVVGGEKYYKGDEDFVASEQGQLAGGLIGAGIIVSFIAYLGVPSFLLRNDRVDDGHFIPRDHAVEVADAYNEKLGSSSQSTPE